MLPFAGMLGCIAVLPLIPATHHWWESNRNRLIVSLCFAAARSCITSSPKARPPCPTCSSTRSSMSTSRSSCCSSRSTSSPAASASRGDLPAHPLTNTTFLAVGAVHRQLRRHHRREHAADPAAAADQLRAQARHAHRRSSSSSSSATSAARCCPSAIRRCSWATCSGVPFFWTLILWKEWAFCCAILLIDLLHLGHDRVPTRDRSRQSSRDEAHAASRCACAAGSTCSGCIGGRRSRVAARSAASRCSARTSSSFRCCARW